MARSEMIKEIMRLQKELDIKRDAKYYFNFSDSKLKFTIASMQDKLDNKEESQDYREIYKAI